GIERTAGARQDFVHAGRHGGFRMARRIASDAQRRAIATRLWWGREDLLGDPVRFVLRRIVDRANAEFGLEPPLVHALGAFSGQRSSRSAAGALALEQAGNRRRRRSNRRRSPSGAYSFSNARRVQKSSARLSSAM